MSKFTTLKKITKYGAQTDSYNGASISDDPRCSYIASNFNLLVENKNELLIHRTNLLTRKFLATVI